MQRFICSECKEEKQIQTQGGTGYATHSETGEKICYACMGEIDAQALREMKIGDRSVLYLCKKEGGSWALENWCGTLSIPVFTPLKGRHNIAHTRYDVWFSLEGSQFWGVQYGDQTQICHIKRIKSC